MLMQLHMSLRKRNKRFRKTNLKEVIQNTTKTGRSTKRKEENKNERKIKVFLVCKKIGNTAQHCRENVYSTNDEIICYNYGSQKHTLKDCQKPKSGSLKFATFFVSSHISRDNPKNSKGLYVYGLDANMQQYSLHSSQLRFKSQEQNHLKIIITTKRRLHE